MYPSYQFWQSWINWFEWLSHICLTDQNHLSAYFDQFQPNAFDWTTTIEKLPQDTFLYRQQDEDIFIDKQISKHSFFQQIFPIPNPISWKNWKVLNLIPNIFNTKSNTFYTKFQYFLDTKFFDTDSDTIQRIEKFQNQEVLKPKHHTLYRTVLQYLWHQNFNQMQMQVQMQVQVVPFGNWTFPQLQLQ